MKKFNPMQYLAIDIANHYGLDKLNYEDRISWVKTNLDYLEDYQNKAEEPILFAKAVQALRDVQAGKPVGHIVHFDSVCSGLQIMSAVMRCKSGASLTGLIDPDNRVDAYSTITDKMGKESISRKQSKEALMTMLYGSTKVPERVFGDDVDLFYKTVERECKGAVELLQILLDSWDSNTLAHSWIMPDNHYVYCPVMETVNKRATLNEWDYTPHVLIRENVALKNGLSNAANVIHSLDAYVLRSLVRRCNYHKPTIKKALNSLKLKQTGEINNDLMIVKRFEETQMADISDLDSIIKYAANLPKVLKNKLITVFENMLKHEPFDVVCIHDSFGCHPNHMNTLRFHYNQILADLSESMVIDDILNQLYGDKDTIDKGESIYEYIINANYALC